MTRMKPRTTVGRALRLEDLKNRLIGTHRAVLRHILEANP